MITPSGLNYVGNKFRMLSIILDNIDTSRTTFIDAFCGSGVVGVNALPYYDNVVLNDGCWQLVQILQAIRDDSNFVKNVERIIQAYNLGKDNKEQFLQCREDFNEKHCTEETFNPYMCYALACHSFSYNIVFNKDGGFSVPSGAGKSWFNPTLKGKLMAFQHLIQSKPVEIFDFTFDELFSTMIDEMVWSSTDLSDTMIYLDPPYSACCADGSVSRSYGLRWGWKEDELLLQHLDKLNEAGAHWMLSNVFENKGVVNTKLKEWAKNYNVIEVPGINYTNAHYQAKPSKAVEVLIRNY